MVRLCKGIYTTQNQFIREKTQIKEDKIHKLLQNMWQKQEKHASECQTRHSTHAQ